MKVACPKCSAPVEVADDLAADARVRCDGCGKRFLPDTAPAEAMPLDLDDSDDTSVRRSRVALFAVGGGLAVLLASVAVGWFTSRPAKPDDAPVAAAPPAESKPPAKKNSEPPPAPPVRKRPEPRVTSARYTSAELLDRYRPGPHGDDGVIFTVTGTVASPADRHSDGEVVLRLTGPRRDGPAVWCRMDRKTDAVAARLPVGAEVAVRGRCAGAGVERGPWGLPPAAPNEVVMADCALDGDPYLPSPAGVDHPKGIEQHGIEVRVTAVQVGRPVIVLGPAGPNPGATARTRDKYLIVRIEVRNRRQEQYRYTHPQSGEAWLRDEWGTQFDYARSEVPAAAGTVVANELDATPTRRWRFDGEAFEGPVAERQTATYYLVFDPKHLGEGKKLFLTLPPAVFGLRVVDQIIRLDQTAVEPLPESSVPDLTPATAQAIEAATAVAASAKSAVSKAEAEAVEAEAAVLVAQLAKGKTPADRVKAGDELRKLGPGAKSATGALCQALFDPSPQVQVTAMDALKAVNPKVHGPVATLVAPLTEADFLFAGSTDRPKAVAALAKLGADGRGALPVLLRYKAAISKPGGWPQVPEVLAAIIKVAPDDPAVAALLLQSLSRDEYGAARATAAVGLSYTKPTKPSVAALGQAVRADPEPEVRLAAVNTLAAFGAEAKAMAKAVEAAKTDPDERVREAARKAAEKIK